MICKHCGLEIDDNVKFCPFCGEEVEQEIKNEEVLVRDSNNNGVAPCFKVFSIVGLVCGIVSIAGVFNLLGLFFGIPGIVFGALGKKTGKKAGLILSIIGFILNIIVLVVIFAVVIFGIESGDLEDIINQYGYSL